MVTLVIAAAAHATVYTETVQLTVPSVPPDTGVDLRAVVGSIPSSGHGMYGVADQVVVSRVNGNPFVFIQCVMEDDTVTTVWQSTAANHPASLPATDPACTFNHAGHSLRIVFDITLDAGIEWSPIVSGPDEIPHASTPVVVDWASTGDVGAHATAAPLKPPPGGCTYKRDDWWAKRTSNNADFTAVRCNIVEDVSVSTESWLVAAVNDVSTLAVDFYCPVKYNEIGCASAKQYFDVN